jgi:glycosyltransferase involved in cell wall biosynthesis
MHICFITDEYPQQGVAHSLAAKGIRVSVLGGGNTNKNFADGKVNIYQIYKSKWPIAKFIDFYWREARLLKDIHRHQPLSVVEGSELSFCFLPKLKGVKNVIRLHGGHHFFTQLLGLPLNWWKSWQEKKSFYKTDYFIGVTKFVIDGTRKYLPIPPDKAIVIFYPVDCNKFYEADPGRIVPFKIVFAGTITEKKGIRQLVMALPIIKAKFPAVTLHIYGRDWTMEDGTSYIKYLRAFIKEDEKNVFFEGVVPHSDLPHIYESAHLCAFPSHMETQGIVVLEAMSMGKAVLFSTAGPGPETIDDLKDGLLADPYSPDAIAEKINYLFSRPGLEKQLGEAARQKMLQRYNITITTEQNITFYQQITGSQIDDASVIPLANAETKYPYQEISDK